MIEMLGVLAIVGVLSIGGMAKFGQAMFRWKSIKCVEEHNLFVQEILKYKDDWLKILRTQESGHVYLAQFLEQSEILPSSWRRSSNVLFDSLGNRVMPFVRNDNNNGRFNRRLDLDLQISNIYGQETINFCKMMFHNVLLPNCEQIYALRVAEKNNGSWIGGTSMIEGCLYCRDEQNCLGNQTVADIENLCRTCGAEQEGCNVIILF